MKKIYLLAIMTLLPLIIFAASDPVAYYPFNGSASDESGNGLHGEVVGATLTEDRFGNPNCAYLFDGMDDYIDCGNSKVLKPQLPVTISAWINLSRNGHTKILTTNIDTTNYYGFFMCIGPDNNFGISYGDGGPFGAYSRWGIKTKMQFETNRWYNITSVISSANEIDIYVDNQLVECEYQGYGDSLAYSDGAMNLGRYDAALNNPPTYYDGILDDVHFYNYAILPNQVDSLYHIGGWEGYPKEQMVAYYPFNGSAEDESGNGLHGEVVGATLTTDRFGNFNSAFQFDGVDDYINFGNNELLKPQFPFTFSVWVNPTSLDDYSGIFVNNYDDSCYYGFQAVMHPDGRPRLTIGNGGRIGPNSRKTFVSDNLLSVDKWYNLVIVANSIDEVKYYINGNDYCQYLSGYGDTLVYSDGPVNIGMYNNNVNGTPVFTNAILDEIKLYNFCLNEETIDSLYHIGGWDIKPVENELVAYYPFNGSAEDESGFGNNGTVYGATLTTDRFGNENSAYYFDGEDDYIEIAHNELVDFDASSESYSYSLWMKCEIHSYCARILEKWNEHIDTAYSVYFNVKNDEITGCVYNGTRYEGCNQSFGNKTDNNWHHLVMTVDNTDQTIRLYCDGVLSSTLTYPDNYMTTNNQPIIIAKRPVHNTFYKGYIDDIQIYDYSISPNQIDSLYHIGGWEGYPEEELVAYYPFNGSAEDESGNGNNGTVYGVTLTTDRFGNENSAYYFDGDGDRVYIEDADILDLDEGLTLSAWINADEFWGEGYHHGNTIIAKWETNSIGQFKLDAYENGNLIFRVSDGYTPEKLIVENTLITNKWYYVAATWNASKMCIYVNGELVGEKETGITQLYQNEYTTDYIQIGHDTGTTSGYTPYWDFSGVIDEVKILNYSLTAEEIKDIYIIDNQDSEDHFNAVSISQQPAFLGDTVNIDVSIDFEEGQSATAFDLDINLADQLEFIDIINETTLLSSSGWQLFYNYDSLLYVSAAGATAIDEPGVLFTIQAVVDTASDIQKLPLEIIELNIDDGDVDFAAIDGAVIIVSGGNGDVDLNGLVQAYDASLILRAVNHELDLTENQLLTADVTLDSTISALDASAILQYRTGLINSLPLESELEKGSVTVELIDCDDRNGEINMPVVLTNAENIYSIEGRLTFRNDFMTFDHFDFADLNDNIITNYHVVDNNMYFSIASIYPIDVEYRQFYMVFDCGEYLTDTTSIVLNELRINENPRITGKISESNLFKVVTIEDPEIPLTFKLTQNFPNPFNPTTTIEYALPKECNVMIKVFDLNGREVETLVNAVVSEGYYAVTWNASHVSSGIYFYQIQAGDFNQVRKCILLK